VSDNAHLAPQDLLHHVHMGDDERVLGVTMLTAGGTEICIRHAHRCDISSLPEAELLECITVLERMSNINRSGAMAAQLIHLPGQLRAYRQARAHQIAAHAAHALRSIDSCADRQAGMTIKPTAIRHRPA
jgi:hypothetical protein